MASKTRLTARPISIVAAARKAAAIVAAFIAVAGSHAYPASFGEELPRGAVARAGTLKLRHAGFAPKGFSEQDLAADSRIYDVAFSPDGKSLASAGFDGTIRIWDVTTGDSIRIIGDRRKPFDAVAYAPDGQTLASGDDDGTIQLWDVATGREVRRFHAGEGEMPVLKLAFTPDGRTLISACVADPMFRAWDPSNARERWAVGRQGQRAVTFAISPGGRFVAVSTESPRIQVHEVATGDRVADILADLDRADDDESTIYEERRKAVAFTPDDRFLISEAGPDGLRTWDTTTWAEARRLPIGDGRKLLGFSTDGQVFATAGLNALNFHDARTGRVMQAIGAGPMWRGRVAFSPLTGDMAVGSRGGVVRFFHPATGREVGPVPGLPGEIVGLASSPDGQELAVSDGSMRLWVFDPGTGRLLRTLNGGPFAVAAGVFYTRDGGSIAAIEDGGISVREARTGDLLRRIQAPRIKIEDEDEDEEAEGFFDRLAITPDRGTLLALETLPPQIGSWDAVSGGAFRTFSAKVDFLECMATSPDGRYVAAGANADFNLKGVVIVWDVRTGRELRRFTAHDSSVRALAFARDGSLATVANDGAEIRVWSDPTAQAPPIVLPSEGGAIACLLFRPDGRLVTGGDDGIVRVWDVDRREVIHHLAGHLGAITALADLPGDRIASGSTDGTVLIWGLEGSPR